MKQVLEFGKFYGATRKQFVTSSFAFAEVEDSVPSEVPTHTHDNAHFLFVVNGEYEAVVKDRKQRYSSSTVLYYPAGTTHRDHFSAAGGRFLTVSLTPEVNKKLLAEILFVDYSTSFNNAEMSWLGKRICSELNSPDSLSPIVLEAMANELLAYSVRSLENPYKPPIWLKTARELIEDRRAESITITEIAAAAGVHPLHLARTFRRFFGCSPGEYVRRCRIELASNLLLHSKEALAEIAVASGFADQSQFTRSFKKATGITPAKFRHLHNS